MTKIAQSKFGTTAAGDEVTLYTLQNDSGMSVSIMNYGGVITTLRVPDKNGISTDVVLGYDTLAEYEKGDKFLGTLVGRYANRIGNARFTLNGKTYSLFANDGIHHLHGGKVGFDRKIWEAEPVNGSLKLTYVSPDGEEGYPGELTVTVIYSLTDDNTLAIDYSAVSDADTICNLTNHSYFNLAGQDSGDVLKQKIQVFGDTYTITDAKSIPTGEIVPVDGTPMDLRKPVAIGDHIDDDFDQLVWAGGYDHNWIINGEAGTLRKMAYAFDEGTGITLTGYTTLPGMQFYAGNYLDGVMHGKGSATNGRRCGFCLESQFYPNSPNCPNFPQPILRKGDRYHSVTAFRFGVL